MAQMRQGRRHTLQDDRNKGAFSFEDSLPPKMVRHTPPEEEFGLWVERSRSVLEGNRATTVQERRWIKKKAIERWPLDDEIRCVQERVRDWSVLEQGLIDKGYEKELADKLASMPSKEELQIWLYREKRGLSWNKIVQEFYPNTKSNSARANADEVLKVRRAHAKVEKLFTKRA